MHPHDEVVPHWWLLGKLLSLGCGAARSPPTSLGGGGGRMGSIDKLEPEEASAPHSESLTAAERAEDHTSTSFSVFLPNVTDREKWKKSGNYTKTEGRKNVGLHNTGEKNFFVPFEE
jgi:hypothetical protein